MVKRMHTFVYFFGLDGTTAATAMAAGASGSHCNDSVVGKVYLFAALDGVTDAHFTAVCISICTSIFMLC